MKLTLSQRRARARAILAESERTGRGIMAAIETVNRRMITEAARPATRVVTETAAARRGKVADRAARIARQVTESMAAEKAATATARPAPPAAEQLAQLDHDDLARVAVRSVSAPSPFWGSFETAPAAKVSESAPPSLVPSRPLHEMSEAELAAHTSATLSQLGETSGLRSPLWAADSPAPARVSESGTPTPARPLHELPADEFADHAAAMFGAYGAARGFASPGWAAAR